MGNPVKRALNWLLKIPFKFWLRYDKLYEIQNAKVGWLLPSVWPAEIALTLVEDHGIKDA